MSGELINDAKYFLEHKVEETHAIQITASIQTPIGLA